MRRTFGRPKCFYRVRPVDQQKPLLAPLLTFRKWRTRWLDLGHGRHNNWLMTSEPDYYEILQVSPQAEPDVIEAAYRWLARKYHPDVNPSPTALQQMSALNRAHDVLKEPRERADYDRRRWRALAQKALEEGAPQPDPALFRQTEPVPWRWRLAAFPFGWLLIAGGVCVVLVALGLIVFRGDDSAGDQTTSEAGAPTSPAPGQRRSGRGIFFPTRTGRHAPRAR